MKFNHVQQVSFDQICQDIPIEEADLKCNLVPLIGLKVIIKSPNTKEFSKTDIFVINPDYKNNLLKIKIPVAILKESKDKLKIEVEEKVDEDRRHLIEAVIVKVMKTRRTLDINSLVVESTKILNSKFNPDPQSIKKRIEMLIEREYIARDADDRRVLKYLA